MWAAVLVLAGCSKTPPASSPSVHGEADQPLSHPAEPLPPPAPVAWEPPTGEPLQVRITGDDFQWVVRYPGTDGQLDTDDDILDHQHLHIPSGWPVQVLITSRDYIYTLRLSAWDLKTLALPNQVRQLELEVDEPGEFELRGDQFCGDTHANLWGTVIVQSPEAFSSWLGMQEREAQSEQNGSE